MRMFLLQRPDRATIDRFIASSVQMPLSYGPVGLTRAAGCQAVNRERPDQSAPPRGFDEDETVAAIGQGEADFTRACAALRAWKQFEIGWAELMRPPDAGITAGTNVALVIRHFGFWSLNGARVVYEIDDRGHDGRFGFAYGTLPNHAEAGEESFEVWLDRRTDQVMYRIHAVSRPRALLARLGYPIARHLQARFRRDSVVAMTRAVSGNASGAEPVKP
jgi:uncharacterized protein (UPF0548 family)